MATLQVYEVLPGEAVERCGGFIGGCFIAAIEGMISFEFDLDLRLGPAAIADSELLIATRLGSLVVFPVSPDPPLSNLAGTVENTALSFTNPRFPEVSWTFSPIGSDLGDIMFWSGTYDEGCCDRFSYTFGGRTPFTNIFIEPVALRLVPEPSTAVLLGVGLVALVRPRAGSGRRIP